MFFDSLGLTFLLMMVSLLTSGFCSGMESAYLSLDRIAIKKLEKYPSPISRLVLFYVDHLNHFIVSILIFNLISNIIATLSANTLFFWYLDTVWGLGTGDDYLLGVVGEVAFVVLFTLAILILSEFVPKRITLLHPKFFAEAGSVLMLPIYTVMYPAVFLLFQFSNFFKKLFIVSSETPSTKKEKKGLPVYRHELLGYVERISSQGGFHKLETDWLVQLLFYMNTPISSIMIKRENLVGLNYDNLNGKNSLLMIKKIPFSNIPIYRESKDNIIGIISKKEIACKHRHRFLSKEDLGKYIKKALLLPENKNIMEVLKDIYHSEMEIALITDEHGGVEGVVSTNHIVTKIFERVGSEESDTLQVRQTGLDLFSIHSEVSLDDVNQFFGINLSSQHFETIGGYLLEQFKYIPKKGEKIEDDYFVYTIKARTPKKIIRIEAKRK